MTTLKESPQNLPSTSNPVRTQDRAEDLLELWRKYGYVMFPEQQAIYRFIRNFLGVYTTLEAGCGNGVGTAILQHAYEPHEKMVIGTDVSPSNVAFASALYPWVDFQVWDILKPSPIKCWNVVCVETLEHVADPLLALKNLIDAAGMQLLISTPNGTGRPRPPDNPYHVCEYTPEEMIDMILQCAPHARVSIWDWENNACIGGTGGNGLSNPDVRRINPVIYSVRLMDSWPGDSGKMP